MSDQSFNMEKIHKAVKEYRFNDALILIKNNLLKDKEHKDRKRKTMADMMINQNRAVS